MKKSVKILIFILLPILLGLYGEFLLKHAINSLDLTMTLANLVPIFSNAGVLAGSLCIVAASILWITAMSKFELSFLYPFLSINYLCIIFGSKLFLNESISLNRYISAIFISIGLILISRSPYSEAPSTTLKDHNKNKTEN